MAKKTSAELLPSPIYIIPSSEKELKMSYGMYNDIMRLIGDPQDATTLLIRDATTRDLVLRRLFTDNKKSVTNTEELIDSFDIEILPSEIDGIIAWVADHLAYFLLSTGRSMNIVMEKYKDQLPQEDKEVSSNPLNDGLTN